MLHFRLGNSEIERLQMLISEETLRIKKANSIIQMTKETEKEINNTKRIIQDKRRTYTGAFPLSAFYDICRTLDLNPDEWFPLDLKESEDTNREAEAKNKYAQTELLPLLAQDEKLLRRHKKMLQCAGAKLGTIDNEIFTVLKKYFELDTDVTIDEAVGMALANIYHSTGDIYEVERIATKGRFAIRETGNCAVDAVFDPELRERMAKKYKQLGRWGRLKLMREYSRIADQGEDYSTVKAYKIATNRLKDLPEYILYGLVICEEGHVVRILHVEENGIIAVEGNYDGNLKFGRSIPFSKLVWEGNDLIVYSRQPCSRYGLENEFRVYEYTNPDAVGYDSLQDVMVAMGENECFKINSESSLAYLLPEIRDTLVILRFVGGKLYNIPTYETIYEDTPSIFPRCSKTDVISAFLDSACDNPTGLVVGFLYTSTKDKLQKFSLIDRELPEHFAREMFSYLDKPGGVQGNLLHLREASDSAMHDIDMKIKILMFKPQEFMELNDDIKRRMVILTPRRDDEGKHEDAEASWVLTLMRSCENDTGTFMEDESKRKFTFKELAQNPLHALLVLEMSFYMTGIGSRLTAEERSILDGYSMRMRGGENEMRSRIVRQSEIRNQHKRQVRYSPPVG